MTRIITGVTFGLLLSCSYPVAAQQIDASVTTERVAPAQPRPAILVPLYAATIALQAYDGYSTLSAVGANHPELNPMVGSMAGHPAVFIAVKSAAATWSIYAAERQWKSGNRGAAIATLVITNGLMAVVAANNARVLAATR